MKRDMDLIRRILVAVEDSPRPVPLDLLTTDADGRGKVGEHVRLLREAGLVDASIMAADGDPFYSCTVERLTWDGHELLSSIADPGVWASVKRRARAVGGSVALSTLRALASAAAAEALGL